MQQIIPVDRGLFFFIYILEILTVCVTDMRFPNTLKFPLRAAWDIKGYPTETLVWPAKQSVNKTILFFIPGNPGLVEYYTPFLQRIYENSPSPHLEIIGGNLILKNK